MNERRLACLSFGVINFWKKAKWNEKKPWIFVVHFDMIQMQNNEDEIKSLQRSYSGLWRWKRVLNVVVLDDIQKHNWMKNGLNVVIKDDRKFLSKSGMEKKPWIVVVGNFTWSKCKAMKMEKQESWTFLFRMIKIQKRNGDEKSLEYYSSM